MISTKRRKHKRRKRKKSVSERKLPKKEFDTSNTKHRNEDTQARAKRKPI